MIDSIVSGLGWLFLIGVSIQIGGIILSLTITYTLLGIEKWEGNKKVRKLKKLERLSREVL